MELIHIEFSLEWPESVDIYNLRSYIINNFPHEGDVIRWSLSEIIDSLEQKNKKLLKINALLIN